MTKRTMTVFEFAEWERQKDVAECGGRECVECGWGCDDPELEICCDCFDAVVFKDCLRGVFGKSEQREARESERAR